MGKILIGPKNVDQHVCRETNTLYLDNSMILTCGAKDFIRSRGIAISYGKRPDAGEPEAKTPAEIPAEIKDQAPGNLNLEEMLESIIRALKEDHGIEDPQSLERLSLAILSRLS